MVMKKIMKTDAPIVISKSEEEKSLFLPGFVYRAGGDIRTVIEDVTQESNSQMRKVIVSDGATEILSVNSIKKDLKEHDSEILPIDERYEIKEEKREIKSAVKGGIISKSEILKAVKKIKKKVVKKKKKKKDGKEKS